MWQTLIFYLPAALFITIVAIVYILEIRLLTRYFKARRNPSVGTVRLNTLKALVLHILSIAGILCMAWGYFIEPYRLEIQPVQIPTEKLQNTSFRIVQISDLHCDRKERLEQRLVEEVNQLRPDLIVFTGDALNHLKALPLLQDTLGSMRASIGKYAVRGNVDNRIAPDTDLFDGTGFTELKLNNAEIQKDRETIALCGLDFKKGRISFQTIRQLKERHFNILLYHNSDLIDYLDNQPIDLYLCGHTHGGQVALPGIGALVGEMPYGRKYDAGLFQVGSIHLYVNRGIGMAGRWAPRVRFFARPEIAVFDIVPARIYNSGDDL